MSAFQCYVDTLLREGSLRLAADRDDGALEDWAVLLPYFQRTLEDAVYGLFLLLLDDPAATFELLRRLEAKLEADERAQDEEIEAMLAYMDGE